MSHRAAQWVLNDAPVTDATALLVLHGLADHASPDGTGAFPSRETLAKYARCSVRSVSVKLKVLEDSGVIVRGDQELVSHIRADRRPTVWNLNYDVQILHPVGSGYDDEQMPARREDDDEVQTPSPGDAYGVQAEVSTGCRNESNDVQVPAHKPNTNQIHEPDTPPPSVSTSPAAALSREENIRRYEMFWEAFPKSRNKKETEVLYAAAVHSGLSHDFLLDKAKGYARQAALEPPERRQYIASSVTWLTDGRWKENYPPEPKRLSKWQRPVAE